VGQKVNHNILQIISSNTGRFSKVFHCHNLQEIYNAAINEYRYVTITSNALLHYLVEIFMLENYPVLAVRCAVLHKEELARILTCGRLFII